MRQSASEESGLELRGKIPRAVWALGFVSLFMDVSSEMIHALLPVYMVSVLGTSTLAVGIIEGVAEATASIVKIFSGALSDWLGKRKVLAVIGYGLAAFTKPVFPLAPSVGWLIAARFVDRVGKGVRGAPRDALIADIAPPAVRGASFGLRQSLDTVGAFAGPLIAIGLMLAAADDFRLVFWIAVIPAFVSLALIAFAVEEPKGGAARRPARLPLHWRELQRLGPGYWWIVGTAAIFTLARFSEAFLILKAQAIGVPLALVPMVLVLMSLAYAVSAYPIGVLTDRVDGRTVLLVGVGLLLVADLVLAFGDGLPATALGVVLWGLHMGCTQGLLARLIADASPPELRGTAFGSYNFVTGIALLIASVLAGALWDAAGPRGTFLAGAGFAALTIGGVLLVRGRLAGRPAR
jgi:MFS family permease